jgi:hypothetical protein
MHNHAVSRCTALILLFEKKVVAARAASLFSPTQSCCTQSATDAVSSVKRLSDPSLITGQWCGLRVILTPKENNVASNLRRCT